MDLSTTAYLSIDAGGSFLKSAVLNTGWEIITGSEYSMNSYSENSRDNILGAFEEVITKGIRFIDTIGGKPGGIGIAIPGPFHTEKAMSLMKHKFQNIYGLNLKKCFRSFSIVPDEVPIQFIHDANAVLVGELWKGHAAGFDNAAVVTMGTGLGFAVSEKRIVLCNEIGGPFMSVYNRPYQEGILEDYTAKHAILEMYHQLRKGEPLGTLTVKDIGRMADEGDRISGEVFLKVGEILADALKEIIVERRIRCLLFGGQISRSFQHMKPALEEGFSNTDHLVRISAVSDIDGAALSGAIISMVSPQDTLKTRRWPA
jgi:glucokinase